MACTFPGARNLAEFWRNIVGGVDCIIDVPPRRWDPEIFHDPNGSYEDRVYTKKGGFLGVSYAFNPLRYGTMPRAVEGAEPDQFLVLRTVHEAMEDARHLDRPIDGERAAFILGRGNYLGAGVGGLLQRGMMTEQTLHIIKALHPEFTPEQLARMKKAIRSKLPGFAPESAPGLIPNITTGRVANRLDFMGPNFTIDAACASSLIATELAVRDLESHRFDLMLVGGCHICSEVPFLQVFAAMGALSRNSKIRPFDKHADGTLAGEGVGILVLKRLDDAVRDGDRIYAVIRGVGTSSDGRAKGVAAPRREGEELALRRAYEMCGFSPATVGLIEAHGTGTPVGDPTEVEALHRVFGPRDGTPPTCALGSVKSQIGHAMPAAGVAGIIKTALSVYHRVLPPTLNCEEPLDELRADDCRFYVNSKLRPWVHGGQHAPRRAGVNAFGFGGVNAHVVLEDYAPGAPIKPTDIGHEATSANDPECRPSLIRELDCELVILQAGSREELRGAAVRLGEYVQRAPTVALRDVAWSTWNSRQGGSHVLSMIASSLPDLGAKLARAARALADPSVKQIKDAKGLYYFEESPVRGGKIAFVFPGEGAQYLNMMADLCIHFPEVRAFFDAADRAVDGAGRYPPSADIFPPPLLSADELKAAEKRLWRIERATEAVLTADGAMYLLLQRLGVVPDMATGHSAGEWVAMAASGILDFDEFVASAPRLDAVYGGLSQDRSVPKAAMLAVGAGRDQVIRLVGEIDKTVHVANDNCPHQVVIVTATQDAEPVMKHLQARGVFVELLPYDRGYHTPVFTYICEPLRSYFSSLKISAPNVLLYSSTTAEPYPNDPAVILETVSQTFAKPLLFRQTIEAMYDRGARIFLEVGPRGILTGFIDDILRGRPHAAIAANHHRRSGVSALLHTLGMLAALHVPLDLTSLFARRTPRMLSFDPTSDTPIDHDAEPGTMQVPLCYPHLELDPAHEIAREIRSQAAESRRGESYAADFSPRSIGDIATGLNAVHPSAYPVVAGVMETTGRRSAPSAEASPAMMQAHVQLMEQFLLTHEELMHACLGSAAPSHLQSKASQPAATAHAPPELTGNRAVAFGVSVPPLIPSPATASATSSSSPLLSTMESSAASATTAAGAKPTPQSIEAVLLGVVADKTGYPREMLDVNLDMEADLGIDSIKRIEILGALQQAGNAVALPGEIDMEAVARLKTLRQIIDFLSERPVGADEAAPSTAAPRIPDAAGILFSGRVVEFVPGEQLVVVREVSIDEDLYLLDHCFDPHVSDSAAGRDRFHVVPLTVSLEMMAEAASLLMPGLRVVGARDMQAGKWIDVQRGAQPVILRISARRVAGAAEVQVAIRPHGTDHNRSLKNAPALAEVTIVFAESFPPPPPPDFAPLKSRRDSACTAGELYANRRMFHGPRFQGIVSMDGVGENGLSAQLEILPAHNLIRSNSSPKFHIDPALLDAAGQLVGYWPVEYVTEGFMMFPIQIQAITLYRENLSAGQHARCEVRIREIGPRQVRADIDLLAPDGSPWMQVHGWTDWRFYWDRSFYDFWRFPNKGLVSEAVDLGPIPGHADLECRLVTPMGEVGTSIWETLGAHLVLSQAELDEYHAMPSGPRRTEWLFGRAAAKDAVRAWLKKRSNLDLYPADVEIRADETGRPYATGPWTDRVTEVPHISISHKGSMAVSVAGRGVLGIDLENIETRNGGFETLAFDEDERRLLSVVNGNRAEWITRAWCAKEAAGKALGVGLSNNPQSLVVKAVDLADGAIRVRRREISPAQPRGNGSGYLVHSSRQGDYIVAIAVEERNGHADAGS